MRGLTSLGFICMLACAYSQSHDLRVGRVLHSDIILYTGDVYKYAIPLIRRTSLIQYPPEEQRNHAVITGIFVKDYDTDDTGGYAIISEGGPGHNIVKIKLNSQWNYGFNFTVNVYGRYYTPS